MTARFNHTIIAATDPTETAAFYRDETTGPTHSGRDPEQRTPSTEAAACICSTQPVTTWS